MDPEGRQHGKNRLDDAVCLDVFDQAGLHRNHLMGSFFVNTAGRSSFSVGRKNRSHFIAVMIRRLHADKFVRNDKIADQVIQDLLFSADLLVIGHIDHRTSAALSGDAASGSLLFRPCSISPGRII